MAGTNEILNTASEFSDELSDKAYLLFVEGKISQVEMEQRFRKIETWARLTQELAGDYKKTGSD
jgi:hypothetical protein